MTEINPEISSQSSLQEDFVNIKTLNSNDSQNFSSTNKSLLALINQLKEKLNTKDSYLKNQVRSILVYINEKFNVD